MSVDYYYVAGEDYATGEGMTLCFLITRAYPNSSVPGSKDESPETRAQKEFENLFGYPVYPNIYNKQTFISKFAKHIPDFALKMIESDDPPGNFRWYSRVHFNFS